MPIVNYVREHMRFMEYAADESIPASERLLWFALMHIMNQRANGKVWPDDFIRISNDRLLTYCPMKFDTMAKARNALKQRGLIEFEKGEKNKRSPAYRMIYFFPQPFAPDGECNPNYTDNMGDNTGGNTGNNAGGNMRGNTGNNAEGNTGDNIINYTGYKQHSTVNSTVNTEEEDVIIINTQRGARTREKSGDLASVYPPRKRELTPAETHSFYWIKDTLADDEGICEMYGFNGRRIIRQIAQSDVYPLALVTYAIEKTYERNKRYPLDNAAAYTVTLLDDWKSQGYTNKDDVQEAKDDWWHYK